MAALKPHFDKYAIDSLKRELSSKIGYLVASKPDCAKIAQIISLSGSGYISESTLYRVFFKNDKSQAYKSTLDIICRYVGFKDSVSFLDHVNETRELLQYNGINPADPANNSLLFQCIENGTYKPIVGFFDSMEESSPQFRISVMVSLFDSLMKSGNRMKFIQHFVQQKYFREFFFEIGHDPKFRIKNYDIAYKQYLKGVDRSKGVAHLQDYVFGNSVLFRHYFLSKQHKKAISHGKRLYQRVRSLEPWQKELHSFPFIRFTVYRLWYMQLTNAAQNLQRDYTKYLIDFCAKHKSMMQPYEQRMLFHTIAEVFANGNTPEIYHEKLKKIYKKEFDRIPDFVFDKHLKYSLPYFEPNGMLHLRP